MYGKQGKAWLSEKILSVRDSFYRLLENIPFRIVKRISLAAVIVAALIGIVFGSLTSSGLTGQVNKYGSTNNRTSSSVVSPVRLNSTVAQLKRNTPPPPPPLYYKIKQGDTLTSIAEKFELSSWKTLYCSNKETIGNDPQTLKPDTKLLISRSVRIFCKIPIQHVSQSNNIPATTAQPLTGYAVSSSFQQCVISRESGGYAHAINPYSGASGLYGFLLSTWMSTPEGAQYPGGAYTAPPSVQTAAFWWLYAKDGVWPWRPYDGC